MISPRWIPRSRRAAWQNLRHIGARASGQAPRPPSPREGKPLKQASDAPALDELLGHAERVDRNSGKPCAVEMIGVLIPTTSPRVHQRPRVAG